MHVWRRTLGVLAIASVGHVSVRAQTDSCTVHYKTFAGGVAASVPDASGDLLLAFAPGAADQLLFTDPYDEVSPPLAPPGGWFVAVSNPMDTGLFWARSDGRMTDPSPGTTAVFQLQFFTRYTETAVDSIGLSWAGGCFSAPNVTVLSLVPCDDPGFVVPDMTSIDSVGIGRVSSPVWDDDEICLAIGARDDLVASVKVILEGPFDGASMSVPPEYSDQIPLSQPYSGAEFDGTILDYDSLQVAEALPDSVIDWVIVGLRTGQGTESIVPTSTHAAIVRSNGTVVEVDGLPLRFPGIAPGGYRLVAGHRNHMAVMSSDTLDLSDGIGSWDFTTSLAAAHTGGGTAMKDLGSGRFGMFAADGDVDGQATAPDFNLWNAATTAGETGYRQSDYNMDGQVTAPDFNLWNANTTAGAASQVPE